MEIACNELLKRLKEVASELTGKSIKSIEMKEDFVWAGGEKTTLTWEYLVVEAYTRRVSLSEHAHYATPALNFDMKKEKGHPFAYHVYGTALTIVTVDCLRGIYEVDAVKMVHDFGSSMNPVIDKGQIEGGLVQGIGWMTMEEIVYDNQGRLRSNTLSNYKVPDIYSAPKEITIHYLQTEKDNPAIFRSKAVGEPPLMYGIGTYFALRDAIKAFNPQAAPPFSAPMTPEKTLMALYAKSNKELQPHDEEVGVMAGDKG